MGESSEQALDLEFSFTLPFTDLQVSLILTPYYVLVGFEYHQAWSRAADLAEAYQIGKLESKAAFALLNSIDEKTVGQLTELVQLLG